MTGVLTAKKLLALPESAMSIALFKGGPERERCRKGL